jgi:hypothetical protein
LAPGAVPLVAVLLFCYTVLAGPALGIPRVRYPPDALLRQTAPTGSSPAGNVRAERAATADDVEAPFGQLSLTSDGALYYVDREHGQIDEVTASGPRLVLSSLNGTSAASGSIAELSGLSLTAKVMWFTVGGSLYRASLDGREVRRQGSVSGAIDLYALPDGTVLFTTARSIFERSPSGRTERVAGGSATDFVEQQGGPHRALGEAINPESVVAVSPQSFYFTNENNLYLVDDGIAAMVKPRFKFFNGELAAGPGGTLYGICDWSICRIAERTFTALFKLPEPVAGAFAAPDALAVSPSGSFYISYTNQSSPVKAGIVELSPNGKFLGVVASSG